MKKKESKQPPSLVTANREGNGEGERENIIALFIDHLASSSAIERSSRGILYNSTYMYTIQVPFSPLCLSCVNERAGIRLLGLSQGAFQGNGMNKRVCVISISYSRESCLNRVLLLLLRARRLVAKRPNALHSQRRLNPFSRRENSEREYLATRARGIASIGKIQQEETDRI